jgi:hypothetical protein
MSHISVDNVPLFVLWTSNVGNTRFRGVNVDGMISFLSIKTNFKTCIIPSVRRNLGPVKRQNMVDNSFDRLLRKIGIINAKIVVKPASLHTLVSHLLQFGCETSLSISSAGINPFVLRRATTLRNCSSFPANLVSVYPVFSRIL